MKPMLFILKPEFRDPAAGAGTFFCPHSAAVEGILAFYPGLRDRLDVRYVDFPRPRPAVIAEIGEANQSCPVLVLPPGTRDAPAPHRTVGDRVFYVGETEIAGFLAAWAGIGKPH